MEEFLNDVVRNELADICYSVISAIGYSLYGRS
jgi:hypothetical protein